MYSLCKQVKGMKCSALAKKHIKVISETMYLPKSPVSEINNKCLLMLNEAPNSWSKVYKSHYLYMQNKNK